MAHDGQGTTPDGVPGGAPQAGEGWAQGSWPTAPGWGGAPTPAPGWTQPPPPPIAAPTGPMPEPGPPTAARPSTAAPWAPAATPAGWAPAQPPAGPPSAPPAGPPSDGSRGGAGRRVLAAVVVLCLVAAAVAVTWYVRRDGDAPTTDTAQPTSEFGAPLPSRPDAGSSDADTDDEAAAPSSSRSSAAAPTTSAAPTPTVSPEEQALAQLQALRTSSLSGLVPDDRWVAQVASKSVGITDPLQFAQNGSHTFYAVDILAESRQAVVSVADPSAVLVLQSTDFGKRSWAADGQPYWVTLVDLDFASSDAVKAWCASTYSGLTPEQLANACAARTLSAPHD